MNQSPAKVAKTVEETSRLFHELEVHQVELEMQNEELRRAREELAASRARYFDLYDLAPVGYLTLSEKGLILEANLTAAQMFGRERNGMTGQPITRFIYRDDQDIYYLSRKPPLPGKTLPTSELRMVGDDGRPFWVQMKAKVAQDDGGPVWRTTLSDITERKQTEETLKESEKRYRTILDNTQEGYFEVDLAGNFTFVNDALCTDLGYTRKELIGMNFNQYTDETAAKKLYELFNRVHRTGKQIRAFEGEFIKKDGTKAFNEISVSLIRNAEDTPVGFRGLSRDITERKQIEEALRESEKKYRLTTDNANDWICLIDLDGKFQYVSPSSQRLSGYPSEEFLKNPDLFLNIIHPDDQNLVKSHLKEVRKEITPHDLDFRIITKEGKLCSIRHSCLPVYNDQGQYIGRSETNREITKQRQAEEALQQALDELEQRVGARTEALQQANEKLQSEIAERKQIEETLLLRSEELTQAKLHLLEDNFRRSLEESPLGVHIFTSEGETLFANRAILDIYGYDGVDELKNTPLKERYTPESFAEYRVRKEKRLRGEEFPEEEYEISIVRKDRKIRRLQVFRRVVLWGGKEQFQALYHDVTDLRKAEENSAELSRELASMGRLATMGEMSASLAHELNQPLTAILSNAQTALRLLVGGSLNSEMFRDILDDIVADDKRASEIIRRLRSMIGREKSRITTLDLRNLVEEVVSILKSETVLRRFRIEQKMDRLLPLVMGDKIQIQQVILNLILNAADALMDIDDLERRKIVLSTTRENTGWVRISVRDFGRGIGPGNLENVFAPFFTTKETGMGMGLTICQTIVRSLGGEIWAENGPDQGANVSFTLPVSE